MTVAGSPSRKFPLPKMWETNSRIKGRTEDQGDEEQELRTKNQFRKRSDEGLYKTIVVGIKIWEHS